MKNDSHDFKGPLKCIVEMSLFSDSSGIMKKPSKKMRLKDSDATLKPQPENDANFGDEVCFCLLYRLLVRFSRSQLLISGDQRSEVGKKGSFLWVFFSLLLVQCRYDGTFVCIIVHLSYLYLTSIIR